MIIIETREKSPGGHHEHLVCVVASVNALATILLEIESKILMLDTISDDDRVLAELIKEKEVTTRMFQVWKYFLRNPSSYFFALSNISSDNVEYFCKGDIDKTKAVTVLEDLISKWSQAAGKSERES
jgi:hypothetical protein